MLLLVPLILGAYQVGDETVKSANQSDDTNSIVVDEENDHQEASETEGANSSNDSGEKTLVFYVYESILPQANVDVAVYSQFNQLLREKGADYTVEFVGFDELETDVYQDKLQRMKENGEQVDLLMTGFGKEMPGEKVMFEPNVEAVKRGLLEPLDDYLQSGQGRLLYQHFNEKLWESMKINQTIYGISNKSEVYTPASLLINEEIAQDAGLTLPREINSLDELRPVLEQISQQPEEIIPLVYSGDDVRDLMDYTYFNSGIAVDYDAGDTPYAFNPFEKAEVTTLLDDLSTLLENGHWGGRRVNDRDFLGLITVPNPLNSPESELMLRKERSVQVEAYQLNDPFIHPIRSSLTGIASWSEHQDEAFDLLIRLNTDPELANLFYYGIEGEHYELEDGVVTVLDHDKRVPGYHSPVNPFIVYPEAGKREMTQEPLITAELSPLVGFELDQTKIEDELIEIQSIYEKYADIWSVRGIDIDEQLKAVNQELKEAGIDQVLEEINRQLQNKG